MPGKIKKISKAIGGALAGGAVAGGAGALAGGAVGAGSGAAVGAIFAGIGAAPGAIAGAVGGALAGGVTGVVGGAITGAVLSYKSGGKSNPIDLSNTNTESEKFYSFHEESSEESESQELSHESENESEEPLKNKEKIKNQSSFHSNSLFNRKRKSLNDNFTTLQSEEVAYQRGLQDRNKQLFCPQLEDFFKKCILIVKDETNKPESPDIRHNGRVGDAIKEKAEKFLINLFQDEKGLYLNNDQLTRLYNAISDKSDEDIQALAASIFDEYTGMIVSIKGKSFNIFCEILKQRIFNYIISKDSLDPDNFDQLCKDGVSKGKSLSKEKLKLFLEDGSKETFAKIVEKFKPREQVNKYKIF